MTLQRVLAALAGRYPSEDRMVPDVERIALLCDLLGHPERAYPAVHLTGTNGKTSTARMVDALLAALGLRTGRYTSPHLQSVTERITLNGTPLDEPRFAELFDEVQPYIDLVDARSAHPMTFFEVLTGMAFAAFADAPVDVAVLEVGLGGKWDATNVVAARTCVVTPIGLDHVALLGGTVEKIATEKAGIISEGATAVLAQQPLDAARVLLRHCAEVGALPVRAGVDFGVVERRPAVGGQVLTLGGLAGTYEEVFLPLFGEHQAGNAACALAAVEAFLGGGTLGSLDADAVRAGFAGVSSPGRLEVLRTSPTVLVDAAHNVAGMQATVAAVEESFGFGSLVAVVACFSDKDVAGMLSLLEPVCTSVVVTETSSPRRMPVDELYRLAVTVFGEERVAAEDRLDDAIDTAVRLAEEAAPAGGAGVLVTGSVVTAGEARLLLSR